VRCVVYYLTGVIPAQAGIQKLNPAILPAFFVAGLPADGGFLSHPNRCPKVLDTRPLLPNNIWMIFTKQEGCVKVKKAEAERNKSQGYK